MIDIDLLELTAVVRSALIDPLLEVLTWEVQTLSTRGTGATSGLLRVAGKARTDGAVKPWVVALKIVSCPEQDSSLTSLGHWQRESSAYTSGLLDGLPGPVIPARCYGISAKPAAVWIWMELLVDSVDGQWELPHYVFPADQLGRFNGACAMDGTVRDAPWLARRHARCWNELTNFDQAWRNERARQALPQSMQVRLQQLWDDRERFFALLDRLPQAFSHFDYKRSNLFLCPRAEAEQAVVAVDWGDCGIGPVGANLALLVGGSSLFFDWEPAHVRQLSAAALDAYLAGLEAAGWRGQSEHARLAYLAETAVYFGPPLIAALAWSLSDENRDDMLRILGRTPEAALEPWLALCEFALDCGDAALELEEHLGV